MAFEKFLENARSFQPRVSVRMNGSIAFNRGAVNRFSLRLFNHVLLFYDKGAQVVGIKPMESQEEGAHPLHPGGKGAWVSAKRFLDYYDIRPRGTRSYDCRWDENEKMIVFSIKEQSSGSESS